MMRESSPPLATSLIGRLSSPGFAHIMKEMESAPLIEGVTLAISMVNRASFIPRVLRVSSISFCRTREACLRFSVRIAAAACMEASVCFSFFPKSSRRSSPCSLCSNFSSLSCLNASMASSVCPYFFFNRCKRASLPCNWSSSICEKDMEER